MEWKVGEIKQVNGEWYQCVKAPKFGECDGCAFDKNGCPFINDKTCDDLLGYCSYDWREDNEEVIFKKLEEVGEPYVADSKCCQQYQCYTTPLHNRDIIYTFSDNIVVLEIKNKEDMKEKNWTLDDAIKHYDEIGKSSISQECSKKNHQVRDWLIELKQYKEHSNSSNIGKNLKPFSLELAKAGKPICTRDGRKARIIYWDLKGNGYSIAAAVDYNNDGYERVLTYKKDGTFTDDDSFNYKNDLMMLPEKKEGWAVIFKDDLLKTEQDAKDLAEKSISEVVRIEKIEYEE